MQLIITTAAAVAVRFENLLLNIIIKITALVDKNATHTLAYIIPVHYTLQRFQYQQLVLFHICYNMLRAPVAFFVGINSAATTTTTTTITFTFL